VGQRFLINAILCLITVARICGVACAQPADGRAAKHPIILSPDYPTDSRGEIVYEEQGETQRAIPVVKGALIHPKILKKVRVALFWPRHSKLLLIGVVTPAGDMIDIKVLKDDGDPMFGERCASAMGRWSFKPAILDGKPIAFALPLQCISF
jgi:hypothetical protein